MIGGGNGITFKTEFYNPKIPARLPVQGFANGSRLRLVLLPTKGPRFHINFVLPKGIVLHFNPRFDQDVVVNNSTKKGCWQDEDRFPQPFQQNRMYTVEFVYDRKIIHILINGNHFTVFVERAPFDEVNLIEIEGGVHIHSAHVYH